MKNKNEAKHAESKAKIEKLHKDFHSKHAESKAEIQKLYEDLHTKQTKLDSLQNQIKKPEVFSQGMQTDSDIKNELDEDKLKTKDQVIKDLTDKLKCINEEHAQEIYDLIAKNAKLEKYKTECSMHTENIQNLTQKFTQVLNEKNLVEKENLELKREIEETEIKDFRVDIDTFRKLENSLAHAVNEKNDLQQTITDLQNEVNHWKLRSENLNEFLNKQNKEFEILKSNCDELRQSLAKAAIDVAYEGLNQNYK